MAHGDYHCCAICDDKMEYSDYSRTKEDICTDCLKALRREGVPVLDVPELLAWAKTTDVKTVRSVLATCGYAQCFYPNPVDLVLMPMVIIPREGG